MKRIMEAARQRGTAAADRMQTADQHLLASARATVRPAQQVRPMLRIQTTQAAQRVAVALDHRVPLAYQVVTQTTRRVLQRDAVPALETLVRLFEPHTALIRQGKPGHPTEFGRVIWLDEVEGGIISRYTVLEGNPAEEAQLPPSLDHHLQVFKPPPRLLAGDRGVYTAANEHDATLNGVKQVVLPTPGAQSATRIAHEQQRWFRQGHNWRSGIEGRISGLKRRHRLDRCRYHGPKGMERWVGWGAITHNLRVIAHATVHSPTGAVIHPCHGFIHGEMLHIDIWFQRVLHQNLVLELDFGHSEIDPLQIRQERGCTVRKLGEVWRRSRHHKIAQPPRPLP
jgi:transposase, IS5 family